MRVRVYMYAHEMSKSAKCFLSMYQNYLMHLLLYGTCV